MSLLDDLRQAAGSLDPQFQPSSNEAGPLLGALVAYQEHGDKFLKAAGEENGTAAVTELLAPQPKEDADGSSSASGSASTKKGKGD